jgi:hypothetical protein
MLLTGNENEIVSRDRFERQLATVLQQIGTRTINKRLVLAIGGLPTAEMPLGVPTAAIPTYNEGGDYHMGDLVKLRPGALAGQVVLIGDEGSNRGRLLVDVAKSIKPPLDESSPYGTDALTYAFIAREDGIRPDFVGELCAGKPPKPYWEFEQLRRVSGVREIACKIEPLDATVRPDALIAVGDCFTAGAELAKRLGISGRYVGGLPADRNGEPDTSWAQVGDCEGRSVLILGAAGVRLDAVVRAVGETGIAQAYTLPAM